MVIVSNIFRNITCSIFFYNKSFFLLNKFTFLDRRCRSQLRPNHVKFLYVILSFSLHIFRFTFCLILLPPPKNWYQSGFESELGPCLVSITWRVLSGQLFNPVGLHFMWLIRFFSIIF